MNNISIDYKMAMKPLIAHLFQRFSRNYQNLWSTGTPKETAELIAFWITEMARQGIEPELVEKFGDQITDSKEFRVYPPKPAQFADFLKSESLRSQQAASGEEDIASVAYKLCTKWKMIYGHLFCGKEDFKEVVDFWTNELKANKVSTKAIKRAYLEVRKDAKFRIYPPTTEAFIVYARLCDQGIDINSIPTPDEAYLAACNDRNPHPLIREARRRVGSYELRTQASSVVRKSFLAAYENVLQEFSLGQLDIENEVNGDVDGSSQESPASDTLSSTIDQILSRISNKGGGQ